MPGKPRGSPDAVRIPRERAKGVTPKKWQGSERFPGNLRTASTSRGEKEPEAKTEKLGTEALV